MNGATIEMVQSRVVIGVTCLQPQVVSNCVSYVDIILISSVRSFFFKLFLFGNWGSVYD